MIKKHCYSAPETELFEVKFEECILSNGLEEGNGIVFGAPRRGAFYEDEEE